MKRSILVPLDGSPLAAAALPHAGRLAQALDEARVVLFHARDPNSADPGPDLRAATELLGVGGVAVETGETPIPGAAAGHAIVEAASGLENGLIVMSTHGRGGLGRLIVGSTADHVVRRAPAPVLLIPNGWRTVWPIDRPLSILVPLDGSQTAERVLGPVADLAEALQATLHLLRVVRVPDRWMYNYSLVFLKFDPEAELAEARAYLDGIADRLRATGRTVTTRAMIGTPYFAVADVARELDADVIAMASHGRGGLDRQVMGSVATDTIRRARRPTLVVGPAVVGLPGLGTATEAEPAVTSQEPAAGEQDETRPLHVGDLMTQPAITAGPDTPLEQVARMMREQRIGCVPIVGPAGEPIGIVTEADFTGSERGIPFWVFRRPQLFGQWLSTDALERLYRDARTMPAREIMTSPVVTTTEDEPVGRLVKRMIRRSLKRVPVERGGRVVGVVARHDLLRLMADER